MEVIDGVMEDIEAGGGAKLSTEQHAVVAKALRRLEKKLKKSQNAKNALGKTPKTPTALEQEEKQLEKGKEKFLPKKLWPMKSASLDTTFADQYSQALKDINNAGSKPAEFISSFTGLLQLEGQLANFLSAVAEGTFANEDIRKMVANGLKSYITAYIGKTIVNKEGEMLKEVAKNDMPGYATAILQKVADQIAVPRIPPNVNKPAVPGLPKVAGPSRITKMKDFVKKNVDKVKGKLAEHRADKTAKKADEASKKPGAQDAAAKKTTADQAHAAAATAKTDADKLHATPEAAAAHNAAAAAQAKVGEHKEGTPEHAAAVAHAASLKTEADKTHPLSEDAKIAHANADALAATAKQAATDATAAAAHPEAVDAAKAAAAAEKAAAETPAALAAKAAETKAAEEAALAANNPPVPPVGDAATPAGVDAAPPAGVDAATPAGVVGATPAGVVGATPAGVVGATTAVPVPTPVAELKKPPVDETAAAAKDDKDAALKQAAINPMNAMALQRQAAALKKVNPEETNKVQKEVKTATLKNVTDVQALIRKDELKGQTDLTLRTNIKMEHAKENIAAHEVKGAVLQQKGQALDAKLQELKKQPVTQETIKELKAHGKIMAKHDKEVAKHEKEQTKLEQRTTQLEERLKPTTVGSKTAAFFRPVTRTVKNTGKAASKFGSRIGSKIKRAFTRKVKTPEEKLAAESAALSRSLDLQNKFGSEAAKIKAQHAAEDMIKAQNKGVELSKKGADLKREYERMKQSKDMPLAALQQQQKLMAQNKEEIALHAVDLKKITTVAENKKINYYKAKDDDEYIIKNPSDWKTSRLKLNASLNKTASTTYNAANEGLSEAAASAKGALSSAKESVSSALGRAKGTVSEAATATGLAAKNAADMSGKAAVASGKAAKNAAVVTGKAAAGLATGAAVAAAGLPVAAALSAASSAAAASKNIDTTTRLNNSRKVIDPMSLANALAIAHNLTSGVMKDALLKYAYINNQNDEVKEKALKKLKREAAEKQAIYDEKKRRVNDSVEELITLKRKKKNLEIRLKKLNQLPEAQRDEGEVESVTSKIELTNHEIKNIELKMTDFKTDLMKEKHNYDVTAAEMVAVEHAVETPKKGGKTRKRARRARKAKSKARPRRAATKQRRAGTKKGRTRFTSEDCFF